MIVTLMGGSAAPAHQPNPKRAPCVISRGGAPRNHVFATLGFFDECGAP